MPNTKINPDIKRFIRYQSLISIFLTTVAELARREGGCYESASELSARIKEDREREIKALHVSKKKRGVVPFVTEFFSQLLQMVLTPF